MYLGAIREVGFHGRIEGQSRRLAAVSRYEAEMLQTDGGRANRNVQLWAPQHKIRSSRFLSVPREMSGLFRILETSQNHGSPMNLKVQDFCHGANSGVLEEGAAVQIL